MHALTSLLFGGAGRPRPSLDTHLSGERVVLRVGDPGDWKAWRVMRDASRDFLIPWEPLWPPNALAYGFFCSLLRRHWKEWRMGTAFAFLVFLRGAEGQEILVGGITLGDVIYAAAQKGTIGYWMGQPYAGQGLMSEAVALVRDFAFEVLRLHRIEASCLPHNEPSKALLRRLGFSQEGFAKAYLQINGRREDHLLWGLERPAAEHKND